MKSNIIKIMYKLDIFWKKLNCIILRSYDIEMGAATSHIETFFKSINNNSWRALYIQNCRRPEDSKYSQNFNKFQQYFQYQVILKPIPKNIINLYINSLKFININFKINDIKFIKDNWKNKTLGAWGIGYEIWLNGIEVTQITYFKQMGGIKCKPILIEITYGLERISLITQKNKNINNLIWDKNYNKKILHKKIFSQNEIEQSFLNINYSNINFLINLFNFYEKEFFKLIKLILILPCYEIILKMSHIFNLLNSKNIFFFLQKIYYIKKINKLSCKLAKIYFKYFNF
ncbi:putative glycyl-tRNA synthetase, alpha subunit [Candidatus Zinderia insecticola CARI]|uniref:Glycine--tRNA ligase alpha subunit n=1 Tax=Zinderia insecticola (strain CARI) TaxID=871271 RepID=E0TJ15_ZINIC|nr:putative glycyl-tRNA synthetase, alpha subunit [Candidatus Zinderia insecticola CARI]